MAVAPDFPGIFPRASELSSGAGCNSAVAPRHLGFPCSWPRRAVRGGLLDRPWDLQIPLDHSVGFDPRRLEGQKAGLRLCDGVGCRDASVAGTGRLARSLGISLVCLADRI